MAACSSILRRWISQSSRTYSSSHVITYGARWKMSRRSFSSSSNNNNGTISSSSSPWLMLPPDIVVQDDPEKYYRDTSTGRGYSFYSLAENKCRTFRGPESVDLLRHWYMEFVSSSHGWITAHDAYHGEIHIFNPITDHSRYLPFAPYDWGCLPYDVDDYGRVKKVITSCSPEDDDCRAMMSWGPHHVLAFCSPAFQEEYWTPMEDLDNLTSQRAGYQDFVYSSRQKLFYCIDKNMGFEVWNLQDPDFPVVLKIDPSRDKENYPWPVRSKEEMELKKLCRSFVFLVVAEETDDIFWVRRHVMPHMALDGSYVNHDDLEDKIPAEKLPYKTIGFDVHKYDQQKCALVYMDGTLDGLAFFIGNSNSFALSASEFPELKSDSIYFTDINELIPHVNTYDLPFGGHDVGIFNYENQTFSPCYYPCDRQSIRRIFPAPLWFTPTN